MLLCSGMSAGTRKQSDNQAVIDVFNAKARASSHTLQVDLLLDTMGAAIFETR